MTDNNPKFTGQDATLTWTSDGPGGTDTDYTIKVSNVSWSRDTGTSDVQHNNNLKAVKVLTDIRFSGSFEYNGQDFDALEGLHFMRGDITTGVESHEPHRGTLTVSEKDRTNDDFDKYVYSFQNVVITSHSRDAPADDVGSSSFDWEAENLIVEKKGPGGNKVTISGP